MIQLAIVADDLTGAADSAALFAGAGLATAIPLGADLPAADVISLSTDSRDLPEAEAVARVTAALARVGPGEPGMIYKKLDSALRGHLRAELAAAMDASGRRVAVVAPALPSERRTTLGGRQLVDGEPLERSAFGRAGVSSDLLATFAGISATEVIHVADPKPAAFAAPRQGRRIAVCDAATDAELDRIATDALAAGVSLLAGSAGLARVLVWTAGLRLHAATPTWRPAAGRPLLVIAGTQHAATVAQIEHAVAAGVAVVRPDQANLDADPGEMSSVCEQVEEALARGRDVIVTTAGLRTSPLGAAVVAERLARIAESRTVQSLIGGVVLTGGDAAAAVCRTLGAGAYWLRGEVRPAIPWGSLAGGRLPGLPLVTKAGSFGGPDTLLACLAHLAAQTEAGGDASAAAQSVS